MIDPRNPPLDRFLKLVQRATSAELPTVPPNPPEAQVCFVDADDEKRKRGLYFNVAGDAAGTREWFGPLSPSLPDQRFTLAPESYSLDSPGLGTWTTLSSAMAAAKAGTGTTLGAASDASQRMVWIMPHTYVGDAVTPAKEAITIESNVHLVSAGSGSSGMVVLENFAFSMPNTGGDAIFSGICFRNCSFDAAMAWDGEFVFVNCQFEDCSFDAADSSPTQSVYAFLRCTGSFSSFSVAPTASCTTSVHFIGTNGAAPLTFSQSITAKGAGQALFFVSAGQEIVVAEPHAPFSFEEGVYAALFTSQSFIVNSVESSVIKHRSTQGGEWRADPGTSLFACPKSAFDTTGDCTFSGNEVLIRGNTSLPVGGGAMLDPISGGTVSFIPFPGNRQRVAQDLALTIPAAGSSVAAQTLNGAPNVHTSGYADSFRLRATYGAGYALQGNSAIPATFRFASFLLKEPGLLEDAREIVFVNVGDSLDDGPIALRLPDGSPSRVGVMHSNLTAHPHITGAEYIILQPDQSVRLMVDRSGPVARYLAIA